MIAAWRTLLPAESRTEYRKLPGFQVVSKMMDRCLTARQFRAHDSFVAANNGDTGLAARVFRRTPAPKRFFYVRSMVTPMGGPCGRGNPAGS